MTTRCVIIMVFTLCCLNQKAQQTIMYTQYTFNKAGMNPAASGTDINQQYYYSFGLARQWVDFDNAPKQNFINFSYTIRPPRSYRFWQNVGFYGDNDESGLLGNTGAYLNYTIHILLHKKTVISFGVFAGIRKYDKSSGYFDNNDPAVQKNKASVLLYPDIIPGFRLSDKKYFMDASVRQITINKLQDFKGHRIGSPSKLQPSIYFDYGRFIALGDNLLMMPSFAVNSPLISPPIIDLNLMFYYVNRVGAGVGIRNASFISGTFQIRFLENLTAGFSYSYPINATRFAAQNSYEVMIGVVPVGMNNKLTGRHSIARCPTLSY